MWTNITCWATQWLGVGILPVSGPEQWLVMLLIAGGQLKMPVLHPFEDDYRAPIFSFHFILDQTLQLYGLLSENGTAGRETMVSSLPSSKFK